MRVLRLGPEQLSWGSGRVLEGSFRMASIGLYSGCGKPLFTREGGIIMENAVCVPRILGKLLPYRESH
jgi:hypothetical protein